MSQANDSTQRRIKNIIEVEKEHLRLLEESDDFWGTDEDINIGNSVYREICNIVGFDINEDDEWGGYTIKATANEICAYNIKRLQEML